MDKVTTVQRKKNMSLIRSKNTRPELLLRKMLFKHGFRYRIHYKIDNYYFDIVFPTEKKL